MFEIYKFEYDNDFINQDELRSYIDMGLITQTEYQEIVGDTNEEAKTATGQPATPAQTDSKQTDATTANGK